MSILDEELNELQRCVEKQFDHSKLEACVKAMVRVKFQPTIYKQVVVCIQFPEEYPNAFALIELKSKYISQKLLAGLTKLCENEVQKFYGKPQVLKILMLVSNFILENPLCCCSEEISQIRKLLSSRDELKLKQKSSSVILSILEGQYKLKYALTVPTDYPDNKIGIESKECNYPPVLERWFLAQCREITRKCVMPPTKTNPKDPPFRIKPSLLPVVSFLIKEAHGYPSMKCPYCKEICLTANPESNEKDEYKEKFVDRVYCGHIYHYQCMDVYLKTPPFPKGGKKCLVCGNTIYHDKWKLTPEVVEKRWSCKQAKQRELDEVVDFLS